SLRTSDPPFPIHGSLATQPPLLGRDRQVSTMSIRIRKLIGAVGLLVLVIVWALLAMALAQSFLTEKSFWTALLYYMGAGLGWTLPAALLIRWRVRTAVNRESLAASRGAACRPPRAGPDANHTAEAEVERRQVVEAGVEGDGRDGFVCPAQANRRTMETRPQQILVRRRADDVTKHAQKVIPAYAGFPREVAEGQRLIGMQLDPAHRIADPPHIASAGWSRFRIGAVREGCYRSSKMKCQLGERLVIVAIARGLGGRQRPQQPRPGFQARDRKRG